MLNSILSFARRIIFLFVILLATPSWAKVSDCELLLDTPAALAAVFDEPQFGAQVLRYAIDLHLEMTHLEQTQPDIWFRQGNHPEGRAKLKLAAFVRSRLIPILSRHMENWDLLSDPDYSSLAEEEQAAILKELAPVKVELFHQIYDLLVPASSDSVILEITRAKDLPLHSDWNEKLVRMYLAAAPRLGWTAELVSADVDDDGIRRAILRISGARANQLLKFERGVHREIIAGDVNGSRANRNRTHTRYAEAFVYEEPELTVSAIKPSEIDIETMRASGAGGQHVNRTDSAVRVRHRPTGLEVTIQSHRSQHQNKADALRILAAKVLEKRRQEDAEKFASQRNQAAELTDENRYVRTYDWRHDQAYLENLMTHGNLEPQLEARLMQVLKSRLARRGE